MAEEAEDDRDAGHDGSGDVRSPRGVCENPLKDRDEDRHAGETDEHGGAVDAEDANPLGEIVAMGTEDKPFISEEGDGDGNQAGKQCRIHVAIGAEVTCEEPIKYGEETVSKYGVEPANEEITENLGD